MSSIGPLPYPRDERVWAWNPACTEDDPGTWWHLLYAMCRAINTPVLVPQHLQDVYIANKIYKPKDLIIKSAGMLFYPEGIRQVKGGAKVYDCGDTEKYYPGQGYGSKPLLLAMDATIEIVAYARLASYDFLMHMLDKQIVLVGTYKDDLGGGWYSEIPLLRFEGHYYSPEREASGSKVEAFRKQLGMNRECLTL